MSATNLMDVIIVPATSAQDKAATLSESIEWGRPLVTESQFVEREELLSQTPFSTLRARLASDSNAIRFAQDKLERFTCLLSEKAYMVWSFDHIEKKLVILRLEFDSQQDFDQLAQLAKGEAERYGMQKAIAWNVDFNKLGVQVGEEETKSLWSGKALTYKELAGGKGWS